MNPILVTALCGMVAGLGVFLVVRELVPGHPQLAAALSNLSPERLAARPQERTDEGTGRERLGRAVERRLGGVAGFRAPVADLELLGMTPARFYADKVITAAIGWLVPSLTGLLAQLLGLPLPFFIPAGLGLLMAAVFWFLPDGSVAKTAKARRTDFAYAAVSYLRLVAMQRLASSGLTSAMEDASRRSDAWMFQRIREELVLAHYSKQTPYGALEALAVRLGVPELKEIADITRLADQGASITSNLMARAASMRDRLISAEHKQAAKATTAMSVPVSALVGVFMMALLYPAAMLVLK